MFAKHTSDCRRRAAAAAWLAVIATMAGCEARRSFDGHRRLASGSIEAAAIALKKALDGGAAGPLLLFDDSTGRTVDIDTRGDSTDVIPARITSSAGIPA